MIRAALLALTALSAPAWADPVVVELYTSQGCSSCPPADALLARLAEEEDIIALALHVDYWDYIGWKDEFADPAYTKRQKAYAHGRGERMIYTPQMIVAGTESVVGTRPNDVLRAIRAKEMDGPDLMASVTGDTIRIEAPAAELSEPLTVHLVRVHDGMSVAIHAGENAGHTIDYSHIVTGWEVLGTWDGTAPLSVEAPIDGEGARVVLLQEAGPGAIHAAVRVE